MYLNNSYFGNGVWGVQDAARKYFGVDASQVTVGEAATLAGMLKGPGIYNPIDYIDNATARRNTVLQLMVDNKKLSQEEANQEASVNLASLLNDTYVGDENSYKYPYYFDAVIDEAVNRYKFKEEDILNKIAELSKIGIQIEIQKFSEEELKQFEVIDRVKKLSENTKITIYSEETTRYKEIFKGYPVKFEKYPLFEGYKTDDKLILTDREIKGIRVKRERVEKKALITTYKKTN